MNEAAKRNIGSLSAALMKQCMMIEGVIVSINDRSLSLFPSSIFVDIGGFEKDEI